MKNNNNPFIDPWDKKIYNKLRGSYCDRMMEQGFKNPVIEELRSQKRMDCQADQTNSYHRHGSRLNEADKHKARSSARFGFFTSVLEENEQESPDHEVLKRSLRARVRKMRENRTAIRLADLHEICICSGESPNMLLGYDTVAATVQLLDYNDLVQIASSKKIKNVVVSSAPALGLALLAHIPAEGIPQNRDAITYSIVDSLGLFVSDTERKKGNLLITSTTSFKFKDKTTSTFEKATYIFDLHLWAACGISTDLHGNNNFFYDACHDATSYLDNCVKLGNKEYFQERGVLWAQTVKALNEEQTQIYKQKETLTKKLEKHEAAKAQQKKSGSLDDRVTNAAGRAAH